MHQSYGTSQGPSENLNDIELPKERIADIKKVIEKAKKKGLDLNVKLYELTAQLEKLYQDPNSAVNNEQEIEFLKDDI